MVDVGFSSPAHYMFEHGWKKPNSRLNIIKYLRAFVNFLHKYEYIEKNFAQELMKPKVPRKDFDYVNPEAVEKIIIVGIARSEILRRFAYSIDHEINDLIHVYRFYLNFRMSRLKYSINL